MLKQVDHNEDRAAQLRRASLRLGLRLEAAYDGLPAFGVKGAPPWAEDPLVVATMIERVEQVIETGHDIMEVTS